MAGRSCVVHVMDERRNGTYYHQCTPLTFSTKPERLDKRSATEKSRGEHSSRTARQPDPYSSNEHCQRHISQEVDPYNPYRNWQPRKKPTADPYEGLTPPRVVSGKQVYDRLYGAPWSSTDVRRSYGGTGRSTPYPQTPILNQTTCPTA